ncbi:MAG: DUF962 domain-containing protein [Erythrobacter sp.]|nr:DUF962 domain-containing protein [Erythrobacter sp.]
MSRLAQSLANYRAYHRDRRNVLTHALGIPLIVLALEVLLARPALPLAGVALTPAIVASAAAAVWYLWLDLKMGLLMTGLLALFVAVGSQIAQLSTGAWLGLGLGLFLVGWVLQFLGHHYEGRKPAFVDDVRSFLVGPLFMVAEGLFALGLLGDLRRQVEADQPH